MTIEQECRAALANFRRGGWLPVLVVLMLAAAIAAVTAVFGIAHAVLLRPIPVSDPDRVFLLWGRDDARSQSVVEVSLLDHRAWVAGQKSFSRIALFGSTNWGELHVTAPGTPFRAVMNAVSAEFFDVLGTRAILGRTFGPEDDRPNAPRTVVLSHDVWRGRFVSDPALIGRTLTVGTGKTARAYEVIGVLPADFRIPAGADVWVALGPVLGEAAAGQKWTADGVRAMYAIGRLEKTAAIDSALAELSTIARNVELKSGLSDTAMRVVATPLLQHLLGPARPALLAIAGAAAMLLLIACANAAGLLLVQGAARRGEMAVRLALGAQRRQLVRLLLVESLILCLVAAALGVSLAYVAFDAIVALAPMDVPRLGDAAIDMRALAFALAVCLLTALAAGLVPAWQHSGGTLLAGLHQRSQSGTAAGASSQARRLLVAAQLATAVVLLTAAGLFGRSFVSLLRLDLGFDPRNVLTFSIGAPDGKYDEAERRHALIDAVIERARQTPGATAAGAIHLRPFAYGVIGMDANIVVEGQPLTAAGSSRNPIVNWEVATPDYFRAMDIRLLRGRLFSERDTGAAPPVVIVSESLAAQLWPGQDPLGRRLLTHGAPGDEKRPGWQTVVGVVEDARYREVERARFDIYLPYRQAADALNHFVVRVAGDPLAAVAPIKASLAALDPGLTMESVTTMEEIVRKAFAPWRFSAITVSILGVMALAFAATGLAAVMAYAVAQRTREIAVRMALGAQPRHVMRIIATDGISIAAAGVAAGLSLAWALRQSVAGMLFGVSPGDGATFIGVGLLLAAVALVAACVPARRAARIDPAVALRAE